MVFENPSKIWDGMAKSEHGNGHFEGVLLYYAFFGFPKPALKSGMARQLGARKWALPRRFDKVNMCVLIPPLKSGTAWQNQGRKRAF